MAESRSDFLAALALSLSEITAALEHPSIRERWIEAERQRALHLIFCVRERWLEGREIAELSELEAMFDGAGVNEIGVRANLAAIRGWLADLRTSSG